MDGFMAEALRERVGGRIGATAQTYLQAVEGDGRALTTRYEYWRELRRLATLYPEKEPAEFDTFDLEVFLNERCLGSSPATRKKVLAILSGYFGYLHDRGRIPTNPTRPIRRPKIPDPEPSWWTGEEIRRILAVETSARNHLLLEMLARTGQHSTVVQ